MKRTQIQIPDRLYDKLKKLAEKEETSFTEIVRKAGEYYSELFPETEELSDDWSPPDPEDLGEFLLNEEEWRTAANMPEEETGQR